ncbi:hypothetical protein [Gilliamella apicola]|nr:hypothetical protein [Gilliamella apicola]WLS91902.1 hypothetical protein RAM21_01760 [Gilliamella apicola]
MLISQLNSIGVYPHKWIDEGLVDLRHFILNNNVKSIAIPALGQVMET